MENLLERIKKIEQIIETLGKRGIGNALTMKQLAADPAAPSSGNTKVYGKSDGKIYKRLPDGTVVEIGAGSASDTPGVIKLYTGDTAPTDYLICDGSAISRTTYAALFAVIGTTYGSGNGTTTFNIPDLKGKVPVGKDTTQTEFNALAKTGGEKTHQLSVTEMPSHNHQFYTIQDDYNVSGGVTPSFGGDNGSTTTWNTNSKGGDTAHNNLQPYIVLNYIIKT